MKTLNTCIEFACATTHARKIKNLQHHKLRF